MNDIKKTTLTEGNIDWIKEVHENAESFSKKEVTLMILEEFDCPSLIEELVSEGYCPECGEKDLEGQNLYEDEEGKCNIYECNNCGHIIDKRYE